MSAYLCGSRHLSAIVNATRWAQYMSKIDTYLRPETRATLYVLNTPDEALYSDLLQTNLESLAARYPNASKISDWTDDEGAYRYEADAMYGSAVEAIKGVQCYEYQSCEHEGWNTSPMKQFCRELVSELISILPGYDHAAWGYEDHCEASR